MRTREVLGPFTTRRQSDESFLESLSGPMGIVHEQVTHNGCRMLWKHHHHAVGREATKTASIT